MRGNGEALDVALGLLRAPALRSALRRRPLPSGVGEVLAIASGSAEGARAAAERTGYETGELLEAARFYVQQVLLVEGADAYRILGADRDADAATLRDHHRMLMRWLHPDRSEGAQWDSALSTRVNQAWNQVRTDAVRAEYDAALEAAAAEDGSLANAPAPAPASALAPVGRSHVAATPRGTFAAITAADLHPAAAWRAHIAPATVALLGLLCLVLVWLAIDRQDNFDDVRGELTGTTAATAAPTPARPALGSRRIEATLPSEPFEVPTPRQPTSLEAETAAPATAPVGAAIAANTPSTPTSTPPSAAPAVHARSSRPAPPRRAPSAPTIDWTPADIHVATPTVAPPRTKPAPTPLEDPLHLFLQAEDTLRGITRYLATQGGAEPLWLDLPVSLEGAGIRAGLHDRHARAPQRMQIESPNWTLDSHDASVTGAYRLQGRRDTIETGVLRLDLTRRDQQWRVRTLSLEPAR